MIPYSSCVYLKLSKKKPEDDRLNTTNDVRLKLSSVSTAIKKYMLVIFFSITWKIKVYKRPFTMNICQQIYRDLSF